MESLTTYNFTGRAAWGEVGAQGEIGITPAVLTTSHFLSVPCQTRYRYDWGGLSGCVNKVEFYCDQPFQPQSVRVDKINVSQYNTFLTFSG